jgi:anti-sigma factor RsiW
MIMNRMPGTDELELMRLLHGEMPAEQARLLRGRLEREPELAAAWARLEKTWSGLELPPAAPAPLGFSQRLLARARQSSQAGDGLSWSAAPVWVRAAAAAALVTGLALGAGAGSWAGTAETHEPAANDLASIAAAQSSSEDAETSLAESYWDSLGDAQ